MNIYELNVCVSCKLGSESRIRNLKVLFTQKTNPDDVKLPSKYIIQTDIDVFYPQGGIGVPWNYRRSYFNPWLQHELVPDILFAPPPAVLQVRILCVTFLVIGC